MIYASRSAFAILRGGRHQLSPTIPRSPGIIPAVLSVAPFRPLRFDCSIKEQSREWAATSETKGFVLHNFFTGRNGE